MLTTTISGKKHISLLLYPISCINSLFSKDFLLLGDFPLPWTDNGSPQID
jgi:hypothetical protein